ncbi:MAG: hypothetical protein LBN95_09570 [Prevotellaceae bacterium]|jgi:hypothetical protein|nr:hypothetical protein [Prevotellaceae bacterium]
MKKIFVISSFLWICFLAYPQENPFKQQALEEFKAEHYDNAIALMEKALAQNQNDAEIYFYLGWFNHYRAYDSRPLRGYDFSYSQKIFEYLDKAIELNPKYGNAKYFYGAECSANAFAAMQNNDCEKVKYFYNLAFQKGAYPKWLIEIGKNILNQCEKNAILFTGGNADFDICMYLQLIENHRKDITIIPIATFIDRPWYIKLLKNGLENCIKKINISLTDNQIDDMRPFKWRTTDIFIPVSDKMKKDFSLSADYQMKWTVEPNFSTNVQQIKIEGEDAQNRTYLSPECAMLVQIVEDNFLQRPIFFTPFAYKDFYADLDKNFQYLGMVCKLLPIKTENTKFAYNFDEMENLMQSENFKDFADLQENPIERIGMYNIYQSVYQILSEHYKKESQQNKLKKLAELYENLKITK